MDDNNSHSELSPCALAALSCASARMRMAARALTQFYDDMMQPSGVLGTQFTLLVAIAARSAVTVTPLAEALVMDRTTLTRNLKPLEKKGLIEVVPGEDDRRQKIIRLTPAGSEMLEQACAYWQQAQTHIVEGLGTEVWRRMFDDLAQLTALAKGWD